MGSLEEKQTVLIVHNYYQIPGGEDTVVANEKKMLEDHGHKVVLYSRNNSELKQMSKLKKLTLPFTTVFNPRTYREIKILIKEERIGIVHVHNTLNLISPAVYYAVLKCKVPIVQTVHNFRLQCPGATFYRDGHICEDCVKHGLRCAVKHSCYRGSKVQTLICVMSTKIHRMTGVYGKINYICLTDFNKEKLLSLKQVKPENVFVKPNFTYSNLFKHDQGRYYLYIGRIEEIKGVGLLVNAFSLMPEKKLILAGTGTRLDYYNEVLKKKRIKNINFIGYQERDSINELLSCAKAVIVASQWYETFGMIIIEAFSSGVPVITGDIGNIGNLVKEHSTGIRFKYNSTSDVIDAVNKFESISDISWEKNVSVEYEERYSPERNYKMLRKVYDNISENFKYEVIRGI